MRKCIKFATCVLNLFLIAVFSLIVFYSINLPDNFYVSKGEKLEISQFITVSSADISYKSVSKINNESNGISTVNLKLAGLIPIKYVKVNEIEKAELIPCGTPFGIKMLTDGVIVVETSSFETKKGFTSPASSAGIQTGDIIISIDGTEVTCNSDIEKLVRKSKGQCLEVCYERSNSTMTAYIKPEKSCSDNCYRAGMWVRDSSAGIGTITFYNPKTGVFAGLGHPVCDVDTGNIMPLSSGDVCDVIINGVKKGRQGYPGELIGSFITGFSVGELDINCNTGLYGKINHQPAEGIPLQIGLRQEVKEGKATIMTTLGGCTPCEYDIEIEKIDMNNNHSKNMIIKVTDEELIEKAGGIVQGMSGSPIIQNGKIVGAVTHVFVNNPTKGYGIFADTMYETSLTIK